MNSQCSRSLSEYLETIRYTNKSTLGAADLRRDKALLSAVLVINPRLQLDI